MIQKMFAIRDGKAEAFLQPFFSIASGSAIRAFDDAINGDKSPLSSHPGDYVLYEIGHFDDVSGELVCLTPLKMLGCGADFVKVRVPSVRSKDYFETPLVKAGPRA